MKLIYFDFLRNLHFVFRFIPFSIPFRFPFRVLVTPPKVPDFPYLPAHFAVKITNSVGSDFTNSVC